MALLQASAQFAGPIVAALIGVKAVRKATKHSGDITKTKRALKFVRAVFIIVLVVAVLFNLWVLFSDALDPRPLDRRAFAEISLAVATIVSAPILLFLVYSRA